MSLGQCQFVFEEGEGFAQVVDGMEGFEQALSCLQNCRLEGSCVFKVRKKLANHEISKKMKYQTFVP